MFTSRKLSLFLVLMFTCFAWSCKTVQYNGVKHGGLTKIDGESFVLASTAPSNFLYASIVKGSVTVRSTYLPTDSGSIDYKEGIDYTIDYKKGTITRTRMSRIPDYANNPTFGVENFDQNKFKNYSNQSYFIWVDYATRNNEILVDTIHQAQYLKAFKNKLERGMPVSIISYGNSIAAGVALRNEKLRFQNRWIDHLKTVYPTSNIKLEDAALPGYTTLEAIAYWEAYIGRKNPDLVLLGWGMNEANIGGMTPSDYKNNLIKLAERSKQFKNAEVVIYSCFRPNENWHYSSHSMDKYTQATKEAAAIANCAYVDVYSVFEKVFDRKEQPSLLSNNMNHPNSFGHWLYLKAFMNMVF